MTVAVIILRGITLPKHTYKYYYLYVFGVINYEKGLSP